MGKLYICLLAIYGNANEVYLGVIQSDRFGLFAYLYFGGNVLSQTLVNASPI